MHARGQVQRLLLWSHPFLSSFSLCSFCPSIYSPFFLPLSFLLSFLSSLHYFSFLSQSFLPSFCSSSLPSLLPSFLTFNFCLFACSLVILHSLMLVWNSSSRLECLSKDKDLSVFISSVLGSQDGTIRLWIWILGLQLGPCGFKGTFTD